MKQNQINCEKLTKMTIKMQNQKLRLFTKVDIDTKLKILVQQISIFYTLRNKYKDIDKEVLTFVSLILAIDTILKEIDIVGLNTSKIRARELTKKEKRERVIQYWSIVKRLKEKERMSFREISNYLMKYHKLQVSYSTIYKIWKDLELNINSEEN
ncbi:helix-turn-helix domain-containing protein [Poseidonibacter lekithochrous]|uniref:helix-turn-helix domain-containing protein n=1 Tax=Poseidonibacter TaxID=2321187 RepID=UPI001C0944A3|nr:MULTISPECIES: helix-turn-helix domain-containing protein [Poseidonibacter]MBU3014020.1 helix-turn-helix domain-containing protein [Poseidonibacter lekithochrous]MDO6827315.1 helix-turn-helix domain-containing protein [Poseidonibacter sp. 1_MG-2023]